VGRSLMVQVFSKERRLTEPKMKPLGMGTLDLHELEKPLKWLFIGLLYPWRAHVLNLVLSL